MKPKRITRTTFLMGVGGAAALAAFGARAMAQAARPNILWIVDDDHPPYMMGPMPITRERIENLGVSHRQGHADIPLCGPARVSLLTGLSVTTHGCDTNWTYADVVSSPLGLEDRIVSRHLREAGYVCGHFGKYVNEYPQDESVAPHWDRWCEVWGESSSPRSEDGALLANVDGTWVEMQSKPSVWAARRCVDYVRDRAGGQPWFAQYCPTDPHYPYTPSERSEHLYDGDRRRVPSFNEDDMSDKPAWMRDLSPADANRIQKEYEGKKEELADLDYSCLRPILRALEATGQLAKTLIFFTSDNGYLHGEHRLRKKDQPYWESAQVPFLVKGPGVGSRLSSNALVNHTDLMPTSCELAGISPASLDVDGRSMLSHLGTVGYSGWRERMLVTGSDDVGPEINPGGSDDPSGRWWLLREGEKAFILRENGEKELYLMGEDPHQERSKADAADPALIERLTLAVEAMKAASGEERRQLEGAP